MATTANINLSSLNVAILTNNMTVTVRTLDSNGITVVLCTMTGNFAGFTRSMFIDAVVACIIATGAGFTASNSDPILKITTNLTGYVLAGTTITLQFPPYFRYIGSLHLATGLIKGLTSVNDPASAANGFVYAISFDTHQLFKISSGVVAQTVALGAGFFPNDIEYNAGNDHFYIPSVGFNYVRKLDVNLNTIANIAVSATPSFARYNATNQSIYVACQGANALCKIDAANAVTTISLTGTLPALVAPVQCRVNSYNGDVWVVSNTSNVIKIVDINDAVIATLTAPDTVGGIGYYPGNNVTEARFLISQTVSGTIRVYDTGGNHVDTISPFTQPTHIWNIDQLNKMVICANGTNLTFYDFPTLNVLNVFTTTSLQSEAVYEGDTQWVYVGTNSAAGDNLYWYGLVTDGTEFSGIFLQEATNDGNCAFCYEYPLIACYNNYVFDLDLAGNTVYNIILLDKHGKKYRQQVTSDSNGVIILDPTPFPEGLFTPENGNLGMQITDANNLPVEIVIGYTIYTCLTLTFEYNNLYE